MHRSVISHTCSRNKASDSATKLTISFKALLAISGVMLALSCCVNAQNPDSHLKNRTLQLHQNGSLAFVPNQGQNQQEDDQEVIFTARGHGYTLALQASRAVLSLAPEAAAPEEVMSGSKQKDPALRPASVITMDWLNSASDTVVTGADPMQQKNNFFPSGAPKTWITNVPSYRRVNYSGVYPGVDLAFYGHGDRLEYDLTVKPGGDARQIRIGLGGISHAEVDSRGNLSLRAGTRELTFLKPVAYQPSADGNHKRSVEVHYRIQETWVSGKRLETLTFVPGDYDRRLPLVIDPVLAYSASLPIDVDFVSAIAVDAQGSMYVAGNTEEAAGAVIEKLDASGNPLFVATLGAYPAGGGFASSIAVDSSGNIYVAGGGGGIGFPTTPNAYQQGQDGYGAFLTSLSPDGTELRYSTIYMAPSPDWSDPQANGLALDGKGGIYITGPGFAAKFDIALRGSASLIYSTLLNQSENAIAVDSAGNAWLAGTATLGVVPTGGAYSYVGTESDDPGATVTKINPDGSTAYLAYLGPGQANGIAVDGQGNAYVTGTTNANDFPTTPGAYQTAYSGGFASELSANGGSLIYSTFLNGPSGVSSRGARFVPTSIALLPACTSQCNAYVAGYTFETDLPLIDPIQNFGNSTPDHSADNDIGAFFLTELNGSGQSAVYSTYLSGVNSGIFTNRDPQYYLMEYPLVPALTVDRSGGVYMAMNTNAGDFPVTVPLPTYETGAGTIAKIAPLDANLLIAIPQTASFTVGIAGVMQGPVPIELRNMGSKSVNLQTPFTISETSFSETDNCGSVLPAGGTCVINVTFLPTLSGAQAAELVINSDASTLSHSAGVNVNLTAGRASNFIFEPITGSLVYGQAPIQLSATSDPELPVTFSATGPATVYGSTLTFIGAGQVTVTASQAGTDTQITQDVTVNSAPLTITAANAEIASGQPVPGFSWTATGFVNGDNASVLTGRPAEGTNATSSSPAGSYPIEIAAGTLIAANYSLLFANGNLTVLSGGQTAPANPQIYPHSGRYATPQTLAIIDATPGAVIYYTTDGSNPTSASTRFTGPALLNTSETVNAIAVANSAASSVSSAGYNVSPAIVYVNDNANFSPGSGLPYEYTGSVNDLACNGVAVVTQRGLLLTNGGTNEANSAWHLSQVPISNFVTDFNFQLTDAVADGFTFTIQNEGPNALGGNGGDLGYGGIGNSVALKFDLHNNSGEGDNSTGIYLNGAAPTLPAIDLTSSGIRLSRGDVMDAHLTYSGTTLTLTLTDTTTHAVFSHTFAVDIPGTIGAATAYVGFTGGTGGQGSTQYILSWVYTSHPQSSETAATPTLTAGASVDSGPLTVTMLDATTGAAIYYTTDGMQPNASSQLYHGPIVVNPGTIINAVAIASGYSNSEVKTESYLSAPTLELNYYTPGTFPLSSPLSFQGNAAVKQYGNSSANEVELASGGGEVGSVWFTPKVPISSFTTDFVFQLGDATADGFTFTIQNFESSIIGTGGGGLGSAGIKKSVSLKFDLHDNAGEGNDSTGLYLNGVAPTVPAIDLARSGVDLHSGDRLTAHVVYNGSVLALTLTDLTTNAVFTTTFPVDIPGTVGATTAYVGFTGATGPLGAAEDILSWQFSH